MTAVAPAPSDRPATPRRVGSGGPPRLALALAGVAAAVVLLPLVALVWRTPWSDLWSIVTSPSVRTALRLSIVVSVAATALALVLGLPLAWLLARVTFPGRRVLRALLTIPMVLPPVVSGIALLAAFGRRGVAGQWLDRSLGVTLPFTTAGAVLAATFVSLPFLVVTVEAALHGMDRRLEDAARTLRAGRWAVFWRVTLPAIRPSLMAGLVLTWARALGEFGATITFAGNFPGRTQTLPLAAYIALESDPPAALAISVLLLAVSVGVLVSLRDRWLRAS